MSKPLWIGKKRLYTHTYVPTADYEYVLMEEEPEAYKRCFTECLNWTSLCAASFHSYCSLRMEEGQFASVSVSQASNIYEFTEGLAPKGVNGKNAKNQLWIGKTGSGNMNTILSREPTNFKQLYIGVTHLRSFPSSMLRSSAGIDLKRGQLVKVKLKFGDIYEFDEEPRQAQP